MNQIALIDESGNYTFEQLQKIARILTFQTQNHYWKYWGKTGEVVAYQHESEAPQSAWRCRIVSEMEEKDKGLNGFHLTEIRNGVTYPYLKVLYHGKETERTISHEMLETWEDPYVNNFMLVKATDANRESIEILVEISDPVQNSDFGYEIEGILVSNFFLPSFYNLVHIAGTKYDYMGWIEKPRQLLDGGYISFKDAKGVWWQAFNRQNQLIFKKLGDNQADLTAQEQGRILELIGIITLVILIVIAVVKLYKYSKTEKE
jgi:hypothetical protein